MKCPVCQDAMLKEIKSGEVFIDLCPVCQGIWFDSGELIDVLTMLVNNKTLTIPPHPALKDSAPISANQVREKTHHCPRCHNDMSKYNYAYDSNVILDRCAHCRGIWADGGEVGMLVAFLNRIKGKRP